MARGLKLRDQGATHEVIIASIYDSVTAYIHKITPISLRRLIGYPYVLARPHYTVTGFSVGRGIEGLSGKARPTCGKSKP